MAGAAYTSAPVANIQFIPPLGLMAYRFAPPPTYAVPSGPREGVDT
jgi:hypothetical protein